MKTLTPLDQFPIFTTRIQDFINWSRKHSLWPLPFGTACCGIEYMAVVGTHYDVSRFGAEVVRFSPRQSDLLIVAGTIVEKMAPILRNIYEQMPDPKWVISMGVCASSGGFYRAYHTVQGIESIVPVDVYVPGCPPTPEAVIGAIIKLQEKISKGDTPQQRLLEKRKMAEATAQTAEDSDQTAFTSTPLGRH
jgi:NADH-quinone oxidoreductase subunit B